MTSIAAPRASWTSIATPRESSSPDPSASSSRERAPIPMQKDVVKDTTKIQRIIVLVLSLVVLLLLVAIAWSLQHAPAEQVAVCKGAAREAAIEEGEKKVLNKQAEAEQIAKTRVAFEQRRSWAFTSTADWALNAILLLDVTHAFPADKKTVTIASPLLLVLLLISFMSKPNRRSDDHAVVVLVANTWLAFNIGFAISRMLKPDFAAKRGTTPAEEQVDRAIKIAVLAGLSVLPAFGGWMLRLASKDGGEGNIRWEANVATLLVTFAVWCSALLFCWKRILKDSFKDVLSAGPSCNDAEMSAPKETKEKEHEEALRAEKRITEKQADEIKPLKKEKETKEKEHKKTLRAEKRITEKQADEVKALKKDKLAELTASNEVGKEAIRKLADLENSMTEERKRHRENEEKLKQEAVIAKEMLEQQRITHDSEIARKTQALADELKRKTAEWQATEQALMTEIDNLKEGNLQSREGFQRMLNNEKAAHAENKHRLTQTIESLKKEKEQLEQARQPQPQLDEASQKLDVPKEDARDATVNSDSIGS